MSFNLPFAIHQPGLVPLTVDKANRKTHQHSGRRKKDVGETLPGREYFGQEEGRNRATEEVPPPPPLPPPGLPPPTPLQLEENNKGQ